MAKHRAERWKKPPEWRGRRLKNRWYAYVKPDLKRRQRGLQSVLMANLQNFIKKLR